MLQALDLTNKNEKHLDMIKEQRKKGMDGKQPIQKIRNSWSTLITAILIFLFCSVCINWKFGQKLTLLPNYGNKFVAAFQKWLLCFSLNSNFKRQLQSVLAALATVLPFDKVHQFDFHFLRLNLLYLPSSKWGCVDLNENKDSTT